MRYSRLAIVGFLVLLGVGCLLPTVAAAPQGEALPATEELPQTTSEDEITQTTTLRRVSETNRVEATVRFAIPSRVTELRAQLPSGATVRSASGLSQAEGSTYQWDGATTNPSVTVRFDPNQRETADGPIADDGRLLFVDTDDWSLVRIPQTGVTGRYTGDSEISLVRETSIDGPGAAGDRITFLGQHRLRTHRAHGQRFELVVPDAASLEERPADIFESLSYASDRLRVGDRDDRVFIVAAPADGVNWGVRGLQTGPADMWIQDDERLDDPANVWVHEYVHSRQDFRPASDHEWFIEGGATYYAALLTLEEERISYNRYRQFLSQGTREPQASSVLSRPTTWRNAAEYRKGALVAGEIDRQIRVETDGAASLDTVFRDMNRARGEVRHREFRSSTRSAANSRVADRADRYITTEQVPAMWDETAHRTAFGEEAARFDYRLADSNPITVSGPDRSTALSGTDLSLNTGETLTVRITAANVGEIAGEYNVAFRVNGAESTRRGQLNPGQQTTVGFDHTFSEAGVYTVTVADERLTVTVGDVYEDSDEIPIEDPLDDDPIADDEPPEEEPIVEDADDQATGFGVISALVAVGLLVMFRHRIREHAEE